jgi:hypothetical protein
MKNKKKTHYKNLRSPIYKNELITKSSENDSPPEEILSGWPNSFYCIPNHRKLFGKHFTRFEAEETKSNKGGK